VTTQAGYAAQEALRARRVKSNHASALLSDLIALDPAIKNEVLQRLTPADLRALLAASQDETGTMFAIWQTDPVGFCTFVLGEALWSKQRALLSAIPKYKRTVVPAAMSVSKTYSAALALVWFSNVYEVGTATTVTTATRMRQVEKQLWPHVRKVVARAGLPGDVGNAQYKIANRDGVELPVAYGFTAPSHDEAAMQGIHAPKLFLIVDEAGGFDPALGRSTRNLLTGDARMLAIGNPATDDENTWFEQIAEWGLDPHSHPETTTIRIPAASSPGITGEPMGLCRECPSNLDRHTPAVHLADQSWVDETVEDYGRGDPYVVARVDARFPKGGSSRAIPSSWVQLGVEAPDPGDTVPLSSLGLDEEDRDIPVRLGSWVRLGVDVAADGGDEFVIARVVGDAPTIEHVGSGAENENPVDVAGVVLEHILRAEALAAALGSSAQVRVKIDGIGVGWGVQGTLKAWRTEGLHRSHIESVVVSEKPAQEPDSATLRPANKRAEMWLAGRSAVQPVKHPGGMLMPGALRLGYLDGRTVAQLSTPKRGTNTGGMTVIEPKAEMKKRGVKSPDRAEAVLLAIYEPRPAKRKGRLIV
jgi:hypothetical protein